MPNNALMPAADGCPYGYQYILQGQYQSGAVYVPAGIMPDMDAGPAPQDVCVQDESFGVKCSESGCPPTTRAQAIAAGAVYLPGVPGQSALPGETQQQPAPSATPVLPSPVASPIVSGSHSVPMISASTPGASVGVRPMRRSFGSRPMGRGMRGVVASSVASDAQASAAGFPAPGTLASNEDFQVLVNSNGAYAYVDEGTVPQSVLTSLGLSLSDAQNLTNAQAQALLNAIAANAASASSAAGTPAAAACDVAFFGDTSCFAIGSTTIGQTTALVLGAAVALLLFLGMRK